MSVAPVAPPSGWAESRPRAASGCCRGSARSVWSSCRSCRHDRTELITRAIQPILWLVIFGQTFSRIRAIPTGERPVPGLSGARHHRAVRAVRRHLLRHPDHLGT